FFAKVPELGVWVISVLLVSLGSDYLHVILDFLYAVRDGSRGDTTGSSTGDGSTNVTVNAPVDTSASDIAALVNQLNAKQPAVATGGTVSVTDVADALG